MKIKVSEATNHQLNWLVAQCQEVKIFDFADRHKAKRGYVLYATSIESVDWEYSPTTYWSQGGPIIYREKVTTSDDGQDGWAAGYRGTLTYFGPTPLVAAMRAYVTSKLGDEVEIPENLK